MDEIIREEDAGGTAATPPQPQASRTPSDAEQPIILPTPQADVKRAALPPATSTPPSPQPPDSDANAPAKATDKPADIPVDEDGAKVAPAAPTEPVPPAPAPAEPAEETTKTAPADPTLPSTAKPATQKPKLRNGALKVLRNLFRFADTEDGEPVFAEDDELSPKQGAPRSEESEQE